MCQAARAGWPCPSIGTVYPDLQRRAPWRRGWPAQLVIAVNEVLLGGPSGPPYIWSKQPSVDMNVHPTISFAAGEGLVQQRFQVRDALLLCFEFGNAVLLRFQVCDPLSLVLDLVLLLQGI